jgi:hypothetical protein
MINEVRCLKCNSIIDLSERDKKIKTKGIKEGYDKFKEEFNKLKARIQVLETFDTNIITKAKEQGYKQATADFINDCKRRLKDVSQKDCLFPFAGQEFRNKIIKMFNLLEEELKQILVEKNE